MAEKSEISLVVDLEKSIKDVLGSAEITLAERIKVIEAGTKLLAVKHKISDPEDKNFFSKKPRRHDHPGS